ncbi:LysE family translocator [Paralcaligenes ginsengisoli]
MVDFDQVFSIALACIVLIVVPGPSVMFIVGRALSHGRRNALATVAGNSLGTYGVAILVSCGIGVILQESYLLFVAIKILGALVLIYLGVQAIRNRKAINPSLMSQKHSQNALVSMRQGFWVGLTNPKAVIVFAVILPQFVHREIGHSTLQMLMLATIPVMVGFCSDTVWALTAARARAWFARSPAGGRAVGALGGLLVMGLGIIMLFSARKA